MDSKFLQRLFGVTDASLHEGTDAEVQADLRDMGVDIDQAKVGFRTLLDDLHITKEMRDHFEERTRRHIALVQKYCNRMADRDPELEGLRVKGELHDASKLVEPERTPYIWLSWKYRCQQEGVPFQLPDGVEERVRAASERHVRSNLHHPEAWDLPSAEPVADQGLDGSPDRLVDARSMPALDMAEMVCDWCAMSEELGGDPIQWADREIDRRWQFTDVQRARVYRWIELAWRNDGGRQSRLR